MKNVLPTPIQRVIAKNEVPRANRAVVNKKMNHRDFMPSMFFEKKCGMHMMYSAESHPGVTFSFTIKTQRRLLTVTYSDNCSVDILSPIRELLDADGAGDRPRITRAQPRHEVLKLRGQRSSVRHSQPVWLRPSDS